MCLIVAAMAVKVFKASPVSMASTAPRAILGEMASMARMVFKARQGHGAKRASRVQKASPVSRVRLGQLVPKVQKASRGLMALTGKTHQALSPIRFASCAMTPAAYLN